jgi:hypothetical protein
LEGLNLTDSGADSDLEAFKLVRDEALGEILPAVDAAPLRRIPSRLEERRV